MSEGTLEVKDKMTSSGEFGNPLRKFKLVFLGEQSGKCQAKPWACHVISVCGILSGMLIKLINPIAIEFLIRDFEYRRFKRTLLTKCAIQATAATTVDSDSGR